MDHSAFSSNTPLHVGDYIALRLCKPEEGWLSSEGLLDDDCFITQDTDDFHGCIWEIHVQNQYSASREYKEALAQSLTHSTDLSKESKNMKSLPMTPIPGVTHNNQLQTKVITPEYLSQLHRAALNEQRLNEKLMSLKRGKPITFGDPIQLRHVKSHKFLTISSNILAREERENMKIFLDSDGDTLSSIGFISRHKFEREGNILTNHSDVVIRLHERSGEFIHAAKANPSTDNPESRTEVNCSLESSYWTLILYQRAVDIGQSSIMAGQLVTLQDPDSLACMTLDHQLPGITEHSKVIMSTQQFQTTSLSNDDGLIGTHLLWLVENANVITGGPLAINVDQVTFRDLNTGLYMRMEIDGLSAVKDRTQASIFEFNHIQSSNSLFSSYLENDASIHLSTDSLWIGCLSNGNPENLTNHGARCSGFIDKTSAVSISLNSSLFRKYGVNLYVGVGATMKLRKLLRVTELYEAGELPIRDLAQEVKVCNTVLTNLCTFLALPESVPVNQNEIRSLFHDHTKDIIIARQNIMREQGLIDVLLDLLSITESNVYDRIKESLVKREYVRRASALRGQQKNSVNPVVKAKKNDDSDDSEADETPKPVEVPTTQRRSSLRVLFGGKTNQNAKPIEAQKSLKSSKPVPPPQPKPKTMEELIAQHERNMLEKNINKSSKNTKNTKKKKKKESDSDSGSSSSSSSSSGSGSGSEEDGEEDEDDDDDYEEEDRELGGGPLNEAKLTASQLIAQRVLKVLLCIIVDNLPNQLYVADRFPVLLAEVRDHRLAVLCVEEMLKLNLTILQTKVRQREIDIFVGLLAQSEMSVTFLRLLQSTTRCPMGVDATQRMVANALFSKTMNRRLSKSENDRLDSAIVPLYQTGNAESRKSVSIAIDSAGSANQRLIIHIFTNRHKKTPVDWGNLSMFCPTDPHKYVKGYDKLADGLPEIWLEWKMKGKNGDFSMSKLFGYYDKVPLPVIYSSMRKSIHGKLKPNYSGSNAFESISTKAFQRQMTVYQKQIGQSQHGRYGGYSSKANNAMANIALCKAQVAEYFRTQLYLVADLCLDRNYVSIGMLEPMFEYDTMVAMLKDPLVPASFKAPVCRVLRCLYVDRDPQIVQQFPRYIRTLIHKESNNGKRSTAIETIKSEVDNKIYTFALLQKILSEYVRNDLDLSYCDELSAEAIELLEALVNFGFYVEVPQILDIWKPMLKVLYRLQTPTTSSIKPKKIENFRQRAYSTFVQARWSLHKTRKPTPLQEQLNIQREEDEDEENEDIPWYMQWIGRTDSLYWLIAVFIVVVASIAMILVQQFHEMDLTIFYLLTTIFFAIEYTFRLFVNTAGHGSQGLKKFVFDRFNLLDLFLILLDIIVFSVGADGSRVSASRATRSLRIIRIFRVARIVRATRLLRQMTTVTVNKKVWEVPQRYRNIKDYEVSFHYDGLTDRRIDNHLLIMCIIG